MVNEFKRHLDTYLLAHHIPSPMSAQEAPFYTLGPLTTDIALG